MTLTEKRKKAALIAVAYFVEQERAAMIKNQNVANVSWGRSGVEMTMAKTRVVQRRGRSLRNA